MSNVDRIADELARAAAELTTGEHRLIKLIGDFDEADGWQKHGALTPAQWLSWRIGMSPGLARERVRVARAIRTLPVIDEAFQTGTVSYSKVRAITRVATRENEANLLETARYTTAAQLERTCRKFSGVKKAESVDEAEALRFVRPVWQDDGTLRLTIQLPPEEGARLMASIDAAHAETNAKTRADAVMTVAESFLADGAKPRRGGAPHEVILNVSAERTGSAIAFIENADAAAVSAETSQRICCDASVTKIVRDRTGDVLDIGRKSRIVPTAMRRALEARDERRCVFPGCDHRLYLDAHHIEHWADGGETKLTNLALLCRRHHTFVHEHGYTMERGDHGFVFTAPNRRPHAAPTCPDPVADALTVLARRNESAGVEIDELTAMCEWDGVPVDYDAVIADLVWSSRAGGDGPCASAETAERICCTLRIGIGRRSTAVVIRRAPYLVARGESLRLPARARTPASDRARARARARLRVGSE